MPEVPALHWSAHATGLASTQPFEARGPIYYTAPGGWLILNDAQPATPDRPWSLLRHGTEVERCHTLRIAKSTANRMTAAQQGART